MPLALRVLSSKSKGRKRGLPPCCANYVSGRLVADPLGVGPRRKVVSLTILPSLSNSTPQLVFLPAMAISPMAVMPDGDEGNLLQVRVMLVFVGAALRGLNLLDGCARR